MCYQVHADGEADKPQTTPSQRGEASERQSPTSSPSAFQAIANAFRRTFSGTNHSSTAVVMYEMLGSCFVSSVGFSSASVSSLFQQESQTRRPPPAAPGLRGSAQLRLALQRRGLGEGRRARSPLGRSVGGGAGPALPAAAGVLKGAEKLGRGVRRRHRPVPTQKGQLVLFLKAEDEGAASE